MNAATTKKVSSTTRHTQFRQPEIQARRIDEILAGRFDITLKTKTDILIDATSLWLDEWDKRNPDGANGVLRAQYALYKRNIERTIRNDFLEDAKEQLHELRHDGDVRRLQGLQLDLEMVIADSHNEPESYIKELQRLLEETTRLLEPSRAT
jgi:hypothetical protein